ncbi:SH3 domain-containing protein [Marivivens donghaensis]|uniref:SH3 domain-containing protein n=1 Tax=Marivivens donghaensis TaxID=1699413 RepID=UPI00201F5657|nr:SH3 domain-containing protein [Marivivens donghaensis]MCL7408152.1 SH3 domain-containing protein [Marivivens donghaensis]MDN3703867.1 SH3 domain-containing protein [Marivivens donghaensis]
MLKVVAASLMMFGAFSTAGHGQGSDRSVDVEFAAGTTGTVISDRLVGREVVLYHLGAEAGQVLDLSLQSSNAATYFNVYAPGSGPGDAALAVSSLTSDSVPDLNQFSATLPVSGDYTVMVYLYRAAARRDGVAEYTLDISITGKPQGIVQNDYADGLMGGPDFWAVVANGGLNLRTGPSQSANKVAVLHSDDVVRNLGCRMAEAQRWCQVQTVTEPKLTGWVAGRFLAEAAEPAR